MSKFMWNLLGLLWDKHFDKQRTQRKMLISESHCRYFFANWESQNIWFSVIAGCMHCNMVSMLLQLWQKKLWAFITGVQWWLEKKINDSRGFEIVNFIHPKVPGHPMNTCYTVTSSRKNTLKCGIYWQKMEHLF